MLVMKELIEKQVLTILVHLETHREHRLQLSLLAQNSTCIVGLKEWKLNSCLQHSPSPLACLHHVPARDLHRCRAVVSVLVVLVRENDLDFTHTHEHIVDEGELVLALGLRRHIRDLNCHRVESQLPASAQRSYRRAS